MNVYVRYNGDDYVFEVNSSYCLLDLQKAIEDKLKVEVGMQKLIWMSKSKPHLTPENQSKTLSECGFTEGCKVHLFI